MKANKPIQQLGFDFDRPSIKPIRLWSADAMRSGWPKCCGYTMTIDSPEEWDD